MKKIGLIIGPLTELGGLSVSIKRHLKLMSAHFKIIPISIHANDDQTQWAGKVTNQLFEGFEGFHIEAGKFDDLTDKNISDHLVNILKENEIDIVHIFGAYKNRAYISMMASMRIGLPYIVSFRGVDLDTRVYDPNLIAQLTLVINNASAITVLHQEAKNIIENVFKKQALIIKNSFENISSIKKINTKNNVLKIATFGEFRRVQGFDFILEAAKKLKEKSVPFELYLFGKFKGREENYYQDMIKEYAHLINQMVSLPHSQVLEKMSQMDILLFPSIADACPNKVLEAMSVGVPFITTNIPGITELVGEDYPYLVDPRNSDQIVELLLKDHSQWKNISSRLENFTPEKIVPQWISLYRDIK